MPQHFGKHNTYVNRLKYAENFMPKVYYEKCQRKKLKANYKYVVHETRKN